MLTSIFGSALYLWLRSYNAILNKINFIHTFEDFKMHDKESLLEFIMNLYIYL